MQDKELFTEQECCPKHKKKSKAKPPKKSNHKHYYEPCILEYPSDWYKKEHEKSGDKKILIHGYCPICGKLSYLENIERWYTKEQVPNLHFFTTHTVPTEECAKELNPNTRTLPTFCVSDMFQKFVELDQKDD